MINIYHLFSLQKSTDWSSNQVCPESSILEVAFATYTDYILYTPIKLVVLCAALVSLGISVYGVTQLQVDFDLEFYLDPNSQGVKMFKANEKYFPNHGIKGNSNLFKLSRIKNT